MKKSALVSIEEDVHITETTKLQKRLATAVFQHVKLYEHHTVSYNCFLTEWVPTIIRDLCEINTVHQNEYHKLGMINYRIVKSALLPKDAHTYQKSYLCHLVVDVDYTVLGLDPNYALKNEIPEQPPQKSPLISETTTTIQRTIRKFIPTENFTVPRQHHVTHGVHLVSLPLMTYSSACTLSYGIKTGMDASPEMPGTFIVNGKRRFIPTRKIVRNNFPLFSAKSLGTLEFRAEHPDRRHRSTSTMYMYIPKRNKKRNQKSFMCLQRTVRVGYKKIMIPLPVMVIALGWTLEDFREAVKLAMANFWLEYGPVFERHLMALELGTNNCTTQHEAHLFIGKLYGKTNNVNQSKYLLRKELFPNLNEMPNAKRKTNKKLKGFFLAYVYGLSILTEEKAIPPSDLDCLSNGRFITAGNMMAILFRKEFRNFVVQGHQILRRRLKCGMGMDAAKIFNHTRFTPKMVSAIATGNWSKKIKGITHPMNTSNEAACISQLRRVASSCLNNPGKHIGPRMVHRAHAGHVGVAKTTENEDCGLIGTMACTARITMGDNIERNWQVIFHFLTPSEFIPFEFPLPKTHNFAVLTTAYKVFDCHGSLLGWAPDVDMFIAKFTWLKHTAKLDPSTTYHRISHLFELRVSCDNGRMVRPLIVVKNLGRLKQVLDSQPEGVSPFPTLLSSGCLEYVSPGQERSLTIGYRFSPSEANKYSHLEFTDVNIVGILAALTPFWRHNQAPRLVHWLGMAKQAIGTVTRRDVGAPMTHSLWYGQKTAVTTQTARDLNMDKEPNCMNLVVMIIPEEENQDDALVFSQRAIDFGLGISSSVRTYTSEKIGNRYKTTHDRFAKPDREDTCGMAQASYEGLQENGLPLCGTRIKTNDAVIGRSVPVKKISGNSMVNAPVNSNKKFRDKSVFIRKDDSGQVESVLIAHKVNSEIAKVRVRAVRIPEVGDKFSSRHSQKGNKQHNT